MPGGRFSSSGSWRELCPCSETRPPQERRSSCYIHGIPSTCRWLRCYSPADKDTQQHESFMATRGIICSVKKRWTACHHYHLFSKTWSPIWSRESELQRTRYSHSVCIWHNILVDITKSACWLLWWFPFQWFNHYNKGYNISFLFKNTFFLGLLLQVSFSPVFQEQCFSTLLNRATIFPLSSVHVLHYAE